MKTFVLFFTGACIVLHNIAIQLREPLPQDDDPTLPDDDGDNEDDTEQEDDGRRVRDFIARSYFTA